MYAWSKKKVEVDICVIGNKAANFFSSVGGNVVASVTDLGDEPQLNDLIGGVKVILDSYGAGETDHVFLVGNEFVNTMTQAARL